MAATTVPEFLHAVVDDAAIFPPGNASLEQAVPDHRGHLHSEYADLVGGFVVSDVKVPDLAALVQPEDAPLAVNLVVTGGVGAIEPAVTWVQRAAGLELRALEFALRDEADLAHNARRLVQVLDVLALEVPVFAEPPPPDAVPSAGWLEALDELAAREVSLKFRTGGATADAFPGSDRLAGCIEAALDRELPFKCTAGLHHAVRHRDDQTGFEHHGFLNVLLATRASLDGASRDDVAEVLEQTDGAGLAKRLADDPETATRTRRWFRSFGSCSVLEPHEDLVELGLVAS